MPSNNQLQSSHRHLSINAPVHDQDLDLEYCTAVLETNFSGICKFQSIDNTHDIKIIFNSTDGTVKNTNILGQGNYGYILDVSIYQNQVE